MSTSTATFPDKAYVQELFLGLFGSGLEVTESASPVSDLSKSIAAFYVDDAGEPQRALVCDLAFSNATGAALTMIPPGVVKDAIKDGEIPGNFMANLHEVLNICVNLFSETSDKHLVLGEILNLGEVPAKLAEITQHASFDVKVPRYGSGVVSLVAF